MSDLLNYVKKHSPSIDRQDEIRQAILKWRKENPIEMPKNNDDDSVFEAGWQGLKANTGSALQMISDAIIDSGKPKDVTMEDWKADLIKNSPFGWNPVVAASELGAEIAKENARKYTPMSANSIAYGIGGVAPYAIGLGATGAAAARTGNYKALGDIARTAAGQAVTKASGMPVFGATIARHSPAITKAAGVVAPAATVGAMQTVPETMIERQSTMDEYVADAKKNNTYVKGRTEAEAREIANRVAADNVGLLTGTNTLEQALLARTPVGKLGRIAKQVGVGAGLNAAEEGAQTIFPLTEAGKSWSWNDPQLLESMVVGGLFGGAAQGVGAATGTYLDNKTASTEPITKEKPATIKANATSGNEDIDRIILEKSKQYGIDPDLVHAVIQQESGYRTSVESSAGAVGLMQLMPGTAKDLGVTDRTDPEQNIDGGIRYLKQMLEMNDNDLDAALASYNGGYGNRHLAQTRLYAHDVKEKLAKIKGKQVDDDSLVTQAETDTDDVSTIDSEDVERNAIEYAKHKIDKSDEDYTFLNDAIRRNDKQAVMDKYSAQDIQDWADYQVLNDQKLNEKYKMNRDANIKKILQNGEIKITNRQMLPFYRQNDTFRGGTIKKVEGGYLYTPPKDFMNRAEVGRIAEENGITEMPQTEQQANSAQEELIGKKTDSFEELLAKARKRREQEELEGYAKEYARQDLATVLQRKLEQDQAREESARKEAEAKEREEHQWLVHEIINDINNRVKAQQAKKADDIQAGIEIGRERMKRNWAREKERRADIARQEVQEQQARDREYEELYAIGDRVEIENKIADRMAKRTAAKERLDKYAAKKKELTEEEALFDAFVEDYYPNNEKDEAVDAILEKLRQERNERIIDLAERLRGEAAKGVDVIIPEGNDGRGFRQSNNEEWYKNLLNDYGVDTWSRIKKGDREYSLLSIARNMLLRGDEQFEGDPTYIELEDAINGIEAYKNKIDRSADNGRGARSETNIREEDYQQAKAFGSIIEGNRETARNDFESWAEGYVDEKLTADRKAAAQKSAETRRINKNAQQRKQEAEANAPAEEVTAEPKQEKTEEKTEETVSKTETVEETPKETVEESSEVEPQEVVSKTENTTEEAEAETQETVPEKENIAEEKESESEEKKDSLSSAKPRKGRWWIKEYPDKKSKSEFILEKSEVTEESATILDAVSEDEKYLSRLIEEERASLADLKKQFGEDWLSGMREVRDETAKQYKALIEKYAKMMLDRVLTVKTDGWAERYIKWNIRMRLVEKLGRKKAEENLLEGLRKEAAYQLRNRPIDAKLGKPLIGEESCTKFAELEAVLDGYAYIQVEADKYHKLQSKGKTSVNIAETDIQGETENAKTQQRTSGRSEKKGERNNRVRDLKSKTPQREVKYTFVIDGEGKNPTELRNALPKQGMVDRSFQTYTDGRIEVQYYNNMQKNAYDSVTALGFKPKDEKSKFDKATAGQFPLVDTHNERLEEFYNNVRDWCKKQGTGTLAKIVGKSKAQWFAAEGDTNHSPTGFLDFCNQAVLKGYKLPQKWVKLYKDTRKGREELYEAFEDIGKATPQEAEIGENAKFQIAYHGTPHIFDEFSLSGVGTGEGAQAHGWGLYFAQNRSVANNYRIALAGGSYTLNGKNLNDVYQDLERKGEWDKLTVLEDFLIRQDIAEMNSDDYESSAWKWFEQIHPQIKGEGALLEVDVPESDVLLDEQKTFNEQPPKVQEAIKKLYTDTLSYRIEAETRGGREFYLVKQGNGVVDINMTMKDAQENIKILREQEPHILNKTGASVYSDISNKLGNHEAASEALNKHGIKGITYDGGNDGRCFVIFDDKAIEIKRKYDSAIKENKAEIKRTFDEIKAEVEKAFPNAKAVKYDGNDILVTLPNDTKVRVSIKDKIIINEKAAKRAREAHGVEDGGDISIQGYWQKASGSDIDGVIAISKDSTEGTAYHESLHMAMDLALTPKEKKALNDHYAKEAEASGKDVEEAIADGYAKWRKNRENAKFKVIFKKLHDFWHRLKAVFTGIENAHNVMRKIESGEVWERKADKAIRDKIEGDSTFGKIANENLIRDEAEFANSVDAMQKGTLDQTKLVKVMHTPLVLQLIGARDLPIKIKYSDLYKIALDKHFDSKSVENVKKLPRKMADPIAIFRSATREDSYVLMLELESDTGATYVASVAIDKIENDGGFEINLLTSAYGRGEKKPNDKWFANQAENGNLLYVNTKKARAWGLSKGVQFPEKKLHNGAFLASSIKTDSDLVKLRKQHPTKYSVTSWAKNKFGKTKNLTHELRVKDAITNLTGLKVAWGHTDKDIIYDEKQGVIRTRTAQDWGRVVPQVAEVVAKRLGMGIKTVDGKKTVDPAMKDYITEYIFTGALTKANTKEAKEFERVMQKNPKESEDILALKCEFERYGALTLSEQAMENLETDVKQSRTLKQKAVWTMMKTVDKYFPILQMSMKMYKKFKETGEELPRYLNPYTIVKNVSGATAQASMLIQLPQKRLSANASENEKLIMESIEATKDMVRREFPSVDESLIQKFKPLELILQEAGMYGDDTEAKKFQTYMVARRMLELHDREGIEEFPEVYNTPEKCEQIIAELENPAYIQAAEDMYNLQTLSLAIQVDCGTLSQTYFYRVTNENKNYIPLRRLIDDEKMTNNADSTKKVEGSARVVWAPFDQAMDNIAKGFVKAQKNKAMAQVGQAAKLLGQAKTIEVVENNQPNSRNVVNYLVNGERVYIEAYPELAMSLKHITESRAATGAIKILSMANRVPRELLTTNNPEFAFSAFFRDAMNFFLYEKGDPVDLFKGLKHTLLRDSVFQEYMTSGASQSVLTAADKDYFARNVTGSDKGSLSGFKNVIKALDKITSAPTEIMEQAVRVAAYEKTKNRVMKEELDNLEAKLRKSGMTEAQIRQAIQEYGMKDAIMTATVEARLTARDLMDFASRGEWGDALNSYSWFANAVIQGGYKSVRALNWKDPANKGKIQGRLLRLAGVCILQAALSAMGEDDDEIKGLSDSDRYMYFHVRVGDSVLRIPKGDDLGIRTLTFWIDMMFNKREATLRRGLLPIENAFPNLLFMSALKPVVEVLANYSFFYNSEIVPKRLQNPALPEREHDAFTSRLAKEIGEAFHWSPKKVDYMMNAYFGGLGRAARGTIDWAVEGKAPKETAVVRRFVVPKGKSSVFVNDAYEYISEQDALYKDWQERRKTDSRAKADEKFDKAKYTRLKFDKEKLKELTEKIRKNRENPRITEAQREANHIAFTKARNKLAESIMFR